jgi:hypothetical protein
MVFAPNQIDEIVSAEMSFLPQKDIDDFLPLTGALAAGRLEPAEIWKCRQR